MTATGEAVYVGGKKCLNEMSDGKANCSHPSWLANGGAGVSCI